MDPDGRPERSESDQAQIPSRPDFPIVGIGASAGALKAFQQLLEHLPAQTGMAFVLVPHLAPSHESLMSSILQRSSKMPIREVKEGVVVEPTR